MAKRNNKKRSKNNKSPKHCLGDLIRVKGQTMIYKTFHRILKIE